MDISEVTCTYCGVFGQIEIKNLLETKPLGSFSLAGVQTKTTGSYWPYAICGSCGHKSRGQRA